MKSTVPMVELELKRRQRALQESDAVIAVSDFVACTLKGIVPGKDLQVIPNLIDIAETQSVAATPPTFPSNAPYVMFIGKLNPLKGADLLPEVLKTSGLEIP